MGCREHEKPVRNLLTCGHLSATHQASQHLNHEPSNEQLFRNTDVIGNSSDRVTQAVRYRPRRVFYHTSCQDLAALHEHV